MDRSTLLMSLHGIISLLWFAFGTVGLRSGNTEQAGIGFAIGSVLFIVGYILGVKYVDD